MGWVTGSESHLRRLWWYGGGGGSVHSGIGGGFGGLAVLYQGALERLFGCGCFQERR